jgi:hypothetical protein
MTDERRRETDRGPVGAMIALAVALVIMLIA